MSQDEFRPRADVRCGPYIRGACPGCGRVRLEVFVDGPEDQERAVGVRCEKCGRQWLLDPDKADFFGDFDERDPLHPPLPDDNPFGAGT